MVLSQRFDWAYSLFDNKNVRRRWSLSFRPFVRPSVRLLHPSKFLAEDLVLGSAVDATEINAGWYRCSKLGPVLQDVFQTECLMELIP